TFNLVVNTSHPLIQDLVGKMTSEQVEEEVKKDCDKSCEGECQCKKEGEECKKDGECECKKETVIKTVYKLDGQDERLHQLFDIALLSAGKLKGEALANFVNRSLTLLG
ncbi:MAG: hypothetical protein J6Y76_02325, partial [Paludibacteraceae bacterium]|nr:hypothetical protein [Paludibacteraceae bacterium]